MIVTLAVSVGSGADRTVHAHMKKALRADVDPARCDESRRVSPEAIAALVRSDRDDFQYVGQASKIVRVARVER